MEPVAGLIKIYCESENRDARLFVQQPPIEKRFILVGTDLEKLVPDFLRRLNEHVPGFVCRHLIETLEQFEMETFTILCDAENDERKFSTSTTIYLAQE
jgi:hypothetical protein